jgi:hypothetical protein
MLKGRAAWVLVALLMCASVSRGQTGAAKASTEPAPAPRHDISGTWTPARGRATESASQARGICRKTANPNINCPTRRWRYKR